MVVANDPPNHDHVIAGVDEIVTAAVEPRGRTLEYGVARRPGVPFDAGEAIVGRGGERAGDRLLALGEDVHGVPVALGEHLEAPRPLVDAHEHERRIERDRGERIGREAARASLPVECRHHGDPGQEGAERVPVVPQVERCVCHGRRSRLRTRPASSSAAVEAMP